MALGGEGTSTGTARAAAAAPSRNIRPNLLENCLRNIFSKKYLYPDSERRFGRAGVNSHENNCAQRRSELVDLEALDKRA